ncbi:MAG TPA: amino acid permease [Acetobacteraceae bacterium]|nr:amino acid permease [Acetobacteraceae bacterium]
MSANQRDVGLVRALGTWGLAASVISIIVGAGIFAVPGQLAASIGAYAPLAFLGCTLAVGAVGICFAEGGSRIPTSGGVYGYIEVALGPLVGYVAGTLKWFGSLMSGAGVAAALADVAASVTAPQWVGVVRAAVVVGSIGGIALINVRGVRSGARLIGLATALKLVPLFVFIAVGATAVHRANLALPATLTHAAPGRAVILALFALIGMETALCASGEVVEPSRTIPRALALALSTVAFLYVSIQVVAQGILGPALAGSMVPLADAMGRFGPGLRTLMLLGAAISMLGCIGSDILGSPRMVFAIARDGLLPRALARVHPRTHVPHVAILSYAAVQIAMALTGTFVELALLSALTVAGLYIAGCFAAWRLARRGIALAGAPLGFRWLGAAACIGIGGMLIIIALASRAEIAGLLALIGISAAAYLLQTRSAAAAT